MLKILRVLGGFAYIPEGDFLGFLKTHKKSISFCVGHIYRVSLKIDQIQLKILSVALFSELSTKSTRF